MAEESGTAKGTALQITLYGENDEVKAIYTRSIIPWGIMKRAIRFSKSFDMENMTEEAADELAGLVVDIFNGQFTVDELNRSSDIGDMFSILMMIVNKVKRMIPSSPSKPGQ
jgi:hypothetical protein